MLVSIRLCVKKTILGDFIYDFLIHAVLHDHEFSLLAVMTGFDLAKVSHQMTSRI